MKRIAMVAFAALAMLAMASDAEAGRRWRGWCQPVQQYQPVVVYNCHPRPLYTTWRVVTTPVRVIHERRSCGGVVISSSPVTSAPRQAQKILKAPATLQRLPAAPKQLPQ